MKKIISLNAHGDPIRIYLSDKLEKEIRTIQEILAVAKHSIQSRVSPKWLILEAVIPFEGRYETITPENEMSGIGIKITPDKWQIVDYAYDENVIADNTGKEQWWHQWKIGKLFVDRKKEVEELMKDEPEEERRSAVEVVEREMKEVEKFLTEEEKEFCISVYLSRKDQ